MHTIVARNVCHALHQGVNLMRAIGKPMDSRGGPVVVAPTPVTTVYERPQERVLFSAVRDANPFFHLMEAMWMLAGARDADFPSVFIRDFGDKHAESDGTIHDAYGYRWRHWFGLDQLTEVVDRLRIDPNDRQAVIQMWDAQEDLADPKWKTRPCNLVVALRVRDGQLDLTTFVRSNDIIWGAYGANAVHFSVLQEYLAARIGVRVGYLYQVSNNWHAYRAVYDDLAGADLFDCRYSTSDVRPMPMFGDVGIIDRDIFEFVSWARDVDQKIPSFYSRWFAEVGVRVRETHAMWRAGDRAGAIEYTENIAAVDWRVACREWMERRYAK